MRASSTPLAFNQDMARGTARQDVVGGGGVCQPSRPSTRTSARGNRGVTGMDRMFDFDDASALTRTSARGTPRASGGRTTCSAVPRPSTRTSAGAWTRRVPEDGVHNTPCESTSCGVLQVDASPTVAQRRPAGRRRGRVDAQQRPRRSVVAPTPRPTPAPPAARRPRRRRRAAGRAQQAADAATESTPTPRPPPAPSKRPTRRPTPTPTPKPPRGPRRRRGRRRRARPRGLAASDAGAR